MRLPAPCAMRDAASDVMPLGPRVARSHVHVTCNMSHHVAMSGQDRPIRITCTQLSDPRFHLTYRTYTAKPYT